MKSKELNLSNATATSVNILNADNYSVIGSWLVPAKIKWSLVDHTAVILNLLDTSSGKLPITTKICLAIKNPGDHLWREVDFIEYTPFFALTLANQLNSDNQDNLKVNISDGVLTVKDGDQIGLLVKSSVAVVIANCTVKIPVTEDSL